MKTKRIIIDTGNEGKYRVIGDLKDRKCPRCGGEHFASKMALEMWKGYCPDCHAIIQEEKRLGRKLTRDEIKKVLIDSGLWDKEELEKLEREHNGKQMA